MHILKEETSEKGGLYWYIEGLSEIYYEKPEAMKVCHYLNGGRAPVSFLARILDCINGHSFGIGQVVEVFKAGDPRLSWDWSGSVFVGKDEYGNECGLVPQEYELCFLQ